MNWASSCGFQASHGAGSRKRLDGGNVNFAHPERLWLLTLLLPLSVWAIRGHRIRLLGWRSLAQRGRAPRDGACA